MELLDQLEREVQGLIERAASGGSHQEELAHLRARVYDLEAENKSLADTLELERRSNKTVLARVDQMLARLRAERESGGL